MRFRSSAGLRACTTLAVVLAGCHVAPSPSTPRFTAVQRLQHDIDTILTAPALERGFWGVLIRSLTRGDTLYSTNPRKLMMPASNMKIVTAAVAADRLGWEYRYETRLLATAPVDDG